MRYIFTFYVVFQLFWQSAAGAKTPTHAPVSQKEKAGITREEHRSNPAAEIVNSIQFHCTTSKIKEQRSLDSSVSINDHSKNIPEEIRKCVNVYKLTPGTPLARLLLFPRHYFW